MPSNIPQAPDTITQSRLKAATMEWLGGMRWHMAITVAWNATMPVKLDVARYHLSRLMAHVDSELVGAHYPKLRADKRTEAVFAFEGVTNHVHVHSLWRAPHDRWFDLGKLFGPDGRGGVWNKIVPGGSYDVEACNWNGGNAEIIGYVLKQQHRFSEADLMVWASDFHRAR